MRCGLKVTGNIASISTLFFDYVSLPTDHWQHSTFEKSGGFSICKVVTALFLKPSDSKVKDLVRSELHALRDHNALEIPKGKLVNKEC